MNDKELTQLERMARTLPPASMHMGKTDTPFGPLYVAWGFHGGRPYGIWGIRGVAQQIEFKPGTSEEDAKTHLVECAMIFATDLHSRNGFNLAERHFRA